MYAIHKIKKVSEVKGSSDVDSDIDSIKLKDAEIKELVKKKAAIEIGKRLQKRHR